jgi:hypothetical protein
VLGLEPRTLISQQISRRPKALVGRLRLRYRIAVRHSELNLYIQVPDRVGCTELVAVAFILRDQRAFSQPALVIRTASEEAVRSKK